MGLSGGLLSCSYYNYVFFGFSPEIAVLAGNLKCNFIPLTVENVHNSIHFEHVTVVNFFLMISKVCGQRFVLSKLHGRVVF